MDYAASVLCCAVHAGTLDALLCSQDGLDNVRRMLCEVSRWGGCCVRSPSVVGLLREISRFGGDLCETFKWLRGCSCVRVYIPGSNSAFFYHTGQGV